ncbi:MAG: PfkB family carbohydrate kinase [Candidatus Altiarchaeota archaeon]
MMSGPLDLVVFGDTAIDYFYEVDKFPKPNTAADVLRSHRFYGGMGANTAVVASSLGLRTGLVSVIGTDVEDYIKYMENMGIRLYLKGVFGDTTKSMFFKNNGEQISFFYKGVTEMLDDLEPGETFERDLIRNAHAVYFGRTYLKLQNKVVRACKNKFVVYNPGYGVFKFDKIPEQFTRILKKTDVLILNEHELDHLRSIGFMIKFPMGPEMIIVTRGRKGSSVYAKNTEVTVGAYRTKVVDSSGAGDAFNAGFIAAHVRGHDIYESVKFGNATASFVVEGWGCQTNLPTWDKVVERVSSIK